MPLGAALGWAGVRWWRTWLIGAVFSAIVEYAQLFVPGRSTSVADVCSNSLGTLLGWCVALLVIQALRRPARPPVRATILAASLFASIVAFTGIALRPSFPETTYFAMWTPPLVHLEWYRGRVVRASLGDEPLPPKQLASSRRVRDLLSRGADLHVSAVAGPLVPSLAALFAIYDDSSTEVLLLGPDRGDLVFRLRTQAASWRLDQPDLRAVDAMARVQPGQPMDVAVHPTGNAYDLTMNRRLYRPGFTAGQAWAFLKYPERFSNGFRSWLNFAWLFGVLLPVGFWGASRWGLGIGAAAIVGALGFLPPAVGLTVTPPTQWIGAFCGMLVGAALRDARIRLRASQTPTE